MASREEWRYGSFARRYASSRYTHYHDSTTRDPQLRRWLTHKSAHEFLLQAQMYMSNFFLTDASAHGSAYKSILPTKQLPFRIFCVARLCECYATHWVRAHHRFLSLMRCGSTHRLKVRGGCSPRLLHLVHQIDPVQCYNHLETETLHSWARQNAFASGTSISTRKSKRQSTSNTRWSTGKLWSKSNGQSKSKHFHKALVDFDFNPRIFK